MWSGFVFAIAIVESVLYKRQACPQQHENDSLTDYQSVDGKCSVFLV